MKTTTEKCSEKECSGTKVYKKLQLKSENCSQSCLGGSLLLKL